MSHTTRRRGNGWDKEKIDNNNKNEDSNNEGDNDEDNMTTKATKINTQIGLIRMSHTTRKRGNRWDKERIDNDNKNDDNEK